ncbi:hypothetical protein MRX96_021193 [Rhipicephalus microplus]
MTTLTEGGHEHAKPCRSATGPVSVQQHGGGQRRGCTGHGANGKRCGQAYTRSWGGSNLREASRYIRVKHAALTLVTSTTPCHALLDMESPPTGRAIGNGAGSLLAVMVLLKQLQLSTFAS